MTQRLNGFLSTHHTCSQSWFYEFECSENFQIEVAGDLEDSLSLDTIVDRLREFTTVLEKERLFRHSHPLTYAVYLKTMGRMMELKSLKEGVGGYTWTIFADLLPNLATLRKQGALLMNQK